MTQDPPPPGWQPPPEGPLPGWGTPPPPPAQTPAPPPAQPGGYPQYPQQPQPGGYPQDPQQPWQYGAPQGGHGQPYPQQPWLGPPVHKPGIVALRPLGLGDLYDGAFKAIRQNGRTMIGFALLVQTAFVAIPAVITAVLVLTGVLDLTPIGSGDLLDESGEDAFGAAAFISQYSGALFSALATILLTGILVHVVFAAVEGRRTQPAQAWAAVRGRIWALIGSTLLNGAITAIPVFVLVALNVVGWVVASGFSAAMVLVSIASVFASLGWWAFAATRLRFTTAVLVLEKLGPIAAVRRSFALTRGAFWRIFGIMILTGLITSIAGGILGVPFALLGGVGAVLWPDTPTGGIVLVAGSYLSTILTASLITPFSSGVVALQYLDQRIRKEGYDVELITRLQGEPR